MDNNGNKSSGISTLVNIFTNKAVLKLLIPILPYILLIFIIAICIFGACSLLLGLFDGDSNSSNVYSSGSSCSYMIDGKSVSNLKVRLLNCEGYTPVSGEELIDFETYITGVVYAENGGGGYEALKTQAIAARSYSLTRAKAMNGGFGVSLKEENGQWILSLRSCTNDQVFCNPDKGCWSDRVGGQTSDSDKDDWSNCTVHSGNPGSKKWQKSPLAEDSNIRKAVKETEGQVFVDSSNNIVKTSYTNTNQIRWNNWATEGKDAFEMLVKDYGTGSIYEPNCSFSGGSVDTSITSDISSLIKLSDADSWNLIAGVSSSTSCPYVNESKMDSMVTDIIVPIRVYASSSGYETKRIDKVITVNKSLVSLFTNVFNDIYNSAPDFVFTDSELYCYSYRLKVSGSSLSAHAYGSACDINSNTKGNGYGDHVYTLSEWSSLPKTRSKYKIIYKDSPMEKIFRKYTLSWGGDWGSGSTDAMHISFIGDQTRARLQQLYGS